MMTSRTVLTAISIVVCLLLSACTSSRRDRELKLVHDEIRKEFGEAANIRFAPGDLRGIFYVTFENSTLNSKPFREKSQRAQKVANLVKENFTSLRGPDEIWVMFLKLDKNFIFLNHVEELATFQFDLNGRPLRPSAVDIYEGDPLTPRATYIENARQSDISARIQLEGTPGQGLTLIPHFTVAGNAEEQIVKAPEEVAFDFAFYSNRQKFTPDMKVRFVADDKSVFEATGKVTSYPADGGTFSEFCYVKIPYKIYKQFISGEVLTVKLDSREYMLSLEEHAALKKMSGFVEE